MEHSLIIKKYKEVLIGGLLALFSIFYLLNASQIRSYGDAAVDSTFLPKILGWMLLGLSVLLIVSGLAVAKKYQVIETTPEEKQELKAFQRTKQLNVAITLIVIAIYIFSMKYIGFMISSALFIFVQSRVMDKRGSIWKNLVVAIISAVVIFYIFFEGFNLTLPTGTLFR